jgi:acyl-CoA hydrolase
VLGALSGHADLGFHTGMITDGVLGLIERGVATGAKKEIDQGLVITGAALGSTAMYGVHIGAVGGQADFSRAAALTGARSVIALRSEYGGGEYGGGEPGGRSAIAAVLRGAVVTTARSDVDAVVTEHGVAALTGCTVAERARRLVAVAAPHHREQLESSLARQDIPA